MENTDELNNTINKFEPSEKKQSSKPLLLGFNTIYSKQKEDINNKKEITVINLFSKMLRINQFSKNIYISP